MKSSLILLAAAATLLFATPIAFSQDAPNGPQYQTGTTTDLGNYLPQGSTSGTALNGSTQLTVPLPGSDAYVYGQNNSTQPTPSAPASTGGSVGVGTTY